MSSTDDYLAEVERRAQAATPGPWEAGLNDLTNEVDVVHDQEQRLWVANTGTSGYDDLAEADAEFIAHARTDVPRLVAALREEREGRQADRDIQRAALDRDQARLHDYQDRLSEAVARGTVALTERDRLAAQVEAVRALAEKWKRTQEANRDALDNGTFFIGKTPGPNDFLAALDAGKERP